MLESLGSHEEIQQYRARSSGTRTETIPEPYPMMRVVTGRNVEILSRIFGVPPLGFSLRLREGELLE
jgi:hypothetical protein